MKILKKHKTVSIIVIIFLVIFVLDILIWRIDVYSNKTILRKDLASVIDDPTVVPEVTEECSVNESKSFKTTSCSVSADVIVQPSSTIEATLEHYFKQLETNDWDTNFARFKTELSAGTSTLDNQKIRFYHGDYDPNGDLDFVDVYRVDNGLALSDTNVQSSAYNGNETNVVVVRFYREQRSSLSHYLIGQFINY